MKRIDLRDAIQRPPRMKAANYAPYLLALLFYAALTALLGWLSIVN